MTRICTFKGHHGWVNDVVFSPGGDQLASASSDGTVRLRSVATGECHLTLIGHGSAVTRVAYSPKGDILSTSGWDKTVRLWDVASGLCRTVVQNFQGHVYGVTWIDANYLVTGCQDGSMMKWQVIKEEGNHLIDPIWIATNGTLNVTGTSIQGVGFTPSNMQLLKQRGANIIHVTSMTSQRKRISDDMELQQQQRQQPFAYLQQQQQHPEQLFTRQNGPPFQELLLMNNGSLTSTTQHCAFEVLLCHEESVNIAIDRLLKLTWSKRLPYPLASQIPLYQSAHR
jgi:WD40 repeat protein